MLQRPGRDSSLIMRPITRALILALFIHIIVLSQVVIRLPQSMPPGDTSPLRITLSQHRPAPEMPLPDIDDAIEPVQQVAPVKVPLPVRIPLQEPVNPKLPAAEKLISDAQSVARTLDLHGVSQKPVVIARQQLAVPLNWSRPIIPVSDNRFAGLWLPLEPQVLDEWQNPDGSRQNKIRLPNGKVVCGRKAATELFEPLVIPIWMYHGC